MTTQTTETWNLTREEHQARLNEYSNDPSTQELFASILRTLEDNYPARRWMTNRQIGEALGLTTRQAARATYSMRRAGLLWTEQDPKHKTRLLHQATLAATGTIEGDFTWQP